MGWCRSRQAHAAQTYAGSQGSTWRFAVPCVPGLSQPGAATQMQAAAADSPVEQLALPLLTRCHTVWRCGVPSPVLHGQTGRMNTEGLGV